MDAAVPFSDEELIRLCQSLIRIPSVNGVDPERAVAEEVARFATAHGLSAEIVGADPTRPNVIVHCGPATDTGLLLIAHTDTVPFGDEKAWTHPPLSGAIGGDRLFGRGAIDNKGGLASALAALVHLHRSPGLLRKRVTLIGVPDEESGATGVLGVHFLHGRGLLSGRGAIYVYPGMDRIEVGHRGVWRFSLTAKGNAFHSGSLNWQNAGIGHNALGGLAEIVLGLERLRFTPGGSGLFEPFRTTVTPTMFNGGSGPSMVPPTATAYVDVRLVPDVPQSEIEAALRQVVDRVVAARPPLQVEMRTEVTIPWTQIPPEAAIVRHLRAVAGEVTGTVPTLTVSGPANESYILNGYGIPTCIYGPVGENGHSDDEYVEIASLAQVARVYAETAIRMGREY